MSRYRNILVPTDYSKSAQRAFAHARDLAAAFKARLRVVHVVAPFEPAYFDHVGAKGKAGGRGEAEAKETARLEAHLRKLLGRSRVRATAELGWGNPAEIVLRLAGEGPCDLVVIGARGGNPWESLILGSVAERVVRHSPAPVLIVGTEPAKRTRARAKLPPGR